MALQEIFSVVKWTGHKYALRKKLQNWQESALYPKDVTPESTCQPGSSRHPLLPTSVTKHLLEDILERNEKGKIVRKYHDVHRRLDSQHRKYLTYIIVDYYIANERYFTLPDMAKTAQCIAERFPPELAVTDALFSPMLMSLPFQSIISITGSLL